MFGIGRFVETGGRRWRIADISRGPGGLWATLEIGDESERVPYAEVLQDLLGPPDAHGAEAEDDPGRECPELAELPSAKQEEILGRYDHLRQLDGYSPWGEALDARYQLTVPLKERLEAKSEELAANGEKRCSAETLRRQRLAIHADGIGGLIHGNRQAVDQRLASIDPDLLVAARRFSQKHQSRAKTSDRAMLALLRAELENAGFDLSEIGRIKLRLILGEASRGLGLHKDARSRRMHANKPHTVYQGRVVSRPAELVQLDATTTTQHVWDPHAGWVRAQILTAIDVYSRCILALRVIPGSVTARDVRLLLWDMGRPTISRSGHPYDLSTWHGLPDSAYLRVLPHPGDPEPGDRIIGQKPAVHPTTILMDHGAENESRKLFAAAERVGISVLFCAPRDPAGKGVIESIHRVIRDIQSQIGTAGGKGESANNHPTDAEGGALLSPADLEDVLWEYILSVYHERPHRGLRDGTGREADLSPRAAFDAYITAGGTVRVPDDPYRFIEFLSTQKCALNDYGLNVDRRRYGSVQIVALKKHMQRGIGLPPKTLTVYYDPHASDVVFARHPVTREWMAIPRIDPDRGTSPPYSELVRRVVEASYGKNLTAAELERRETDLVKRWHEGVLNDVKDARLAAIERARAAGVAQDRVDAPAVAQLIADAVRDVPEDSGTYHEDDTDLDESMADEWDDLGEASAW